MTDDPYSFEPLPTSDNQPKPPSSPPRIGIWEVRLWMVCFWAAFISGLFDAFLIAVGLMMNQFRPPAASGSFVIDAAAFVWSGVGLLCDCVLALIAAILAMVVFGSARQGATLIAPLAIWLLIRAPVIAFTLGASILLNAEQPWNVRIPDLWPDTIMRPLMLDAPILILIVGVGLRWFLKRGPGEPLPRRPPAEPFAPWP